MEKNRILFIGTNFFNIEAHIKKEFEKNGYVVDYFNDRPSDSSFVKGLIKLNKSLMKPLNKKYLDKIIQSTENKCYSKIFILNGKIIDKDFLLKMKGNHSKAEFIFYTYDSIALYPNVIETLSLYDRTYTFDLSDSIHYENLELLPLFYNRNFSEMKKVPTEYDLLSVCTAHPNRYSIIKELFPKLKKAGVRIYSYLYINELQFLYNMLFVKGFNVKRKKDLTFKKLDEKENIELMSKSKAIFDVEHNQQTGLTMRTIETLGAKKKLITTNRTIKNYNFYNESNILVLEDLKNTKIIEQFLNEQYEPIDTSIYEMYSIESWSKVVLGNEKAGEFTC